MGHPPAEAGGLGLATNGGTAVAIGDQGPWRGPGKAIGRAPAGPAALVSPGGGDCPRAWRRAWSGTGISGTVSSARRVIGARLASAGSAG
jgi:hypothetical protein